MANYNPEFLVFDPVAHLFYTHSEHPCEGLVFPRKDVWQVHP